MNYEITGILINVFSAQTFSKGFTKREFVIETTEKYSQKVVLQLVQDKCDMIDSYSIGDTVTVSFNVKGRDWVDNSGTVKYFNTLEAWRIVGKGRIQLTEPTADMGYGFDDDDFFGEIDTGPKKNTPKSNSSAQPTVSTVKGINIFSGSNDPFGAALTNPTHYNPRGGTSSSKGKLVGIYKQLDKGIIFGGKTYKDVEEAYFSLRKEGGATPENIKLITDLEEAKLRQYPFLVDEITKRGGIEFLEKSIHTYNTSDNPETYQKKEGSSWTSDTGDIFLKTLIEAYKKVVSNNKPQTILATDTSLEIGKQAIRDDFDLDNDFPF